MQSEDVKSSETIREDAATEGIAVEKHPVVSRQLPAGPSRLRRSPWPAIGATASVLTLIAVCAVIWLQLQALAPAEWVSANVMHNNCYADRTNVTCTFTNLSETAATTCTRGRLVQKEDRTAKLETVIMCTGKLLPAETRVIVGPWIGGFADDLCHKENNFGKILDWTQCAFDNEAVDLPALRAAAAK